MLQTQKELCMDCRNDKDSVLGRVYGQYTKKSVINSSKIDAHQLLASHTVSGLRRHKQTISDVRLALNEDRRLTVRELGEFKLKICK